MENCFLDSTTRKEEKQSRMPFEYSALLHPCWFFNQERQIRVSATSNSSKNERASHPSCY